VFEHRLHISDKGPPTPAIVVGEENGDVVVLKIINGIVVERVVKKNELFEIGGKMEDLSQRFRDEFEDISKIQVQKGLEKYGVTLHTFNGRSAALDAAQELVDAFAYLTQLKLEHKETCRILAFFAISYGFWNSLSSGMQKHIETIIGTENLNQINKIAPHA
jgi:hypothetical protein